MNIRISNVTVLGSGSYAHVFKAKVEYEENNVKQKPKYYAIKRNIETDRCSSVTLREYDIMERLKCHPFFVNLVKICDDTTVEFGSNIDKKRLTILGGKKNLKNEDKFDNWYIISELAYETEKIDVKTNILPIAYQMILAVKYMHDNNMCHRDITCSNILAVEDSKHRPIIKFNDFGLSCVNYGLKMTDRCVCTIQYRSPELQKCFMNEDVNVYDNTIDIWSVGCVLYNYITGNDFIHLPDKVSKNEKEQHKIDNQDYKTELSKINEKFKLLREELESIALEIVNDNETDVIIDIEEIYDTDVYKNHMELYDIITQMLEIKPRKRITLDEAANNIAFRSKSTKYVDDLVKNMPVKIYTEPDFLDPKFMIENHPKFYELCSEITKKALNRLFKPSLIAKAVDFMYRYYIAEPKEKKKEDWYRTYTILLQLADIMECPNGAEYNINMYSLDNAVWLPNRKTADELIAYCVDMKFELLNYENCLIRELKKKFTNNERMLHNIIRKYYCESL